MWHGRLARGRTGETPVPQVIRYASALRVRPNTLRPHRRDAGATRVLGRTVSRAGAKSAVLVVLLTPAAIACFATTTRADDLYYLQKDQLREVKKRIRAELTCSDVPADSPYLRRHIRWLDDMADDLLATEGGYWSKYQDVNHPHVSHSGAAFHEPLLLATAYLTPASEHYHDKDVLAAVEKGLRHLLRFAHPDCPERPPGNWWAWDIGIPTHLLTTLIMLEGQLDPELFQTEVTTVTRLLKAREDVSLTGSWIKPKQIPPGITDMNRLWHNQLRLRLAALVENPAMAGKWSLHTFAEIAHPGAGAWQEDFSYKFHGKNPMWAYGRAFVVDYPRLVHRYQGTDFGPTSEQLHNYARMLDHFVNGFLYRNRICPAIVGREISRRPYVHHNTFALASLGIMAKSDHPRAKEFAAIVAREKPFVAHAEAYACLLAAHLAGVPTVEPAPPVDDVFAYPDSDFLQVTRPGWAAGIKMHSSRNAGYESINGENLQGWFLSHGSTFHYMDGDEWDACWPTIDWTRLPGTTVAVDVKGQNQSPFVGVLRGSSKVALAAQEIRCEQFQARKSWLVSGDHIVCLGSDVRGPGRVETTVLNQPVERDTPVLIDGEPAPAGSFRKTLSANWLWADRMGYIFPEPTKLTILREIRTSDWSSIRYPQRFGAGDELTHAYVTAFIDHDSESTGYKYIIVPDVSRDDLQQRLRPLIERYELANRGPHRLATKDGRLESIILWEEGHAGTVQTDRGCMLLRLDDHWQVVDPSWTEQPLHLRVGDRAHEVVPANGRAVTLK